MPPRRSANQTAKQLLPHFNNGNISLRFERALFVLVFFSIPSAQFSKTFRLSPLVRLLCLKAGEEYRHLICAALVFAKLLLRPGICRLSEVFSTLLLLFRNSASVCDLLIEGESAPTCSPQNDAGAVYLCTRLFSPVCFFAPAHTPTPPLPPPTSTPQHTSLHRALIPPPPLSIPIPLPLLLRGGGCDLCYDASLNAQRSQRRGQKAAPVEVHPGGGRDTQQRGTPEPSYRYNEAAKVNMDCWRRRARKAGGTEITLINPRVRN